MNEEREPPKVFGREMRRTPGGWTVVVGIIRFNINCVSYHEFGIIANISTIHVDISYRFATEEAAVSWLEITSSQVMRECFEIARPMITIDAPRVQGDEK